MAKSEEEVIAKLNELTETYGGGPKVPGAKTVYGQSSWFNDEQVDMLLRGYKALLQNPTVAYVYSPLLHQYKGEVLSGGDTKLTPAEQFEWATKTFESDYVAMRNSDLGVMLNTASSPDSGQAWEAGALYAMGKPVVSVYEGDLDKDPINLMISFSSSAALYSTDELKNYNFLAISPNKFEGKII